MRGGRVEPVECVGVGGVTGLDPLGLGQAQLVEQDLLQLLGRAEVELTPDDVVGVVLGGGDLPGELGPPTR